MNIFLLIFVWLLPAMAGLCGREAFSQAKDSLQKVLNSKNQIFSSNSTLQNTPIVKPYKPEIFTSGFIDIINSGQVNASVRFVRLYIGEPGKFAVPLSLYSGVSSNSFQNPTNIQRSNDVLVTNFINPLSGLANISIDGFQFFNRKSEKATKSGWLYHFGERVLTGIRTGSIGDPATGKPINFLNTFGSLGLYFQTGAWDRNNAKNVGVFWLALRYIGCYTNPNQLKEILPAIETNGVYHDYSLAWGVEINNLVNIKVIYYKYIKKPEINYYLPIYQFSFNYSTKK
jgi:hypothetical protein